MYVKDLFIKMYTIILLQNTFFKQASIGILVKIMKNILLKMQHIINCNSMK
jgi:hypothetical protein